MLKQPVLLKDGCKRNVIMVEGANTRFFCSCGVDLDGV